MSAVGNTVVRLADLGAADTPMAGGKAANLGELVRAGFPVPPGFVLPAEAYLHAMREAGLADEPAAPVAAAERRLLLENARQAVPGQRQDDLRSPVLTLGG